VLALLTQWMFDALERWLRRGRPDAEQSASARELERKAH
jgi:hypothetical protein